MNNPKYPSLYQVNTRVFLTELSRRLGRPATLDDIPDSDLDQIAKRGFDWVWLLSVWQTGTAGQRVSRDNQEWKIEFKHTLSDLKDSDIEGSGFAITDYKVHEKLGGDDALAKLRKRLAKRNLKLMLDFVPNHTAPDHQWVKTNPEYYVSGTKEDLAKAPQNYTRVGESIFAYGRDPYFAGWPDTLQLNYHNPATQAAMKKVLLQIGNQCDGLRCDMAMLALPEIFERTWGKRSEPFWTDAINAVKREHPTFVFMAEVYWDLEWQLQQLGFDYTYDKRLYDRLRERNAKSVWQHLLAPLDYQTKLARFLENHDEPRAASTFPLHVHKAAAIITFLSPGLRFFHEGQFEGREKRISPHLVRAPKESVNRELEQFYDQLLGLLKQPILRDGEWRLLESRQAWDGNWTSACFVCFAWSKLPEEHLLVAVNYAPNHSQCYLPMPLEGLADGQWRLADQMGNAIYDRDGNELLSHGLYLDMEPWQFHVFSLTKLKLSSGKGESDLRKPGKAHSN